MKTKAFADKLKQAEEYAESQMPEIEEDRKKGVDLIEHYLKWAYAQGFMDGEIHQIAQALKRLEGKDV